MGKLAQGQALSAKVAWRLGTMSKFVMDPVMLT